MLFYKMVKAQDEGNVDLWRKCLHDDWEFLMHSSGKKFTAREAPIQKNGQN